MNTIKKITKIICLSLFLTMALNAESTVIWNQDKVLESITYRKVKELKTFISVASKEQLNEKVYLAYDGGDASLLGAVMNIMFQEKEFETIINLMLEKGSNIDGIENDSLKPLAVLIRQKNWNIAKKLLDAGASIDIQIERMRSYAPLPLLYVAIEYKEWKPFLDFALDYNPKLIYTESMKDDYKSYLKEALYDTKPSVKLVRYLLTHGEKADEESRNTSSPYFYFLFKNSIFNPHKDDEAYRNRLEVFNLLLDSGINPFLKSSTNCLSPLALVQNDIPTLNRLLEKGLNPNDGNCYKKSNLSIAATLGHLEVFKILLEKGGNLFQGQKNNADAFYVLMSDKESDSILEWLFTNKKEVFETLSSKDVKQYMEAMIENKKDGAYFDIIELLLKSSDNHQKTIDSMTRVAINKNKLKTAEYFTTLGAKLIDHSCECQQTFWNKKLDNTMVDWLLAHNVNPFLGKKSIEEVVNIDKLSIIQFQKIIEMSPKDKSNNIVLQKLLKGLVESHDLNKKFLLTEKKIELLKSYGLEFDEYLNGFMAKQIEQNNDVKILWLLTQGIRVSSENQEHYIDSTYMRALIDRAGEGVKKIDFYPENEEQKVELEEDIFYHYKKNEWYLKNIALFVKPSNETNTSTPNVTEAVTVEEETLYEPHILDKILIAYKTKKIDPNRYILRGIIGLFYLFLFTSFISLIMYFMREKREPSIRKIVPSTMLQIPVLLMLFCWAGFLINALSLDYNYLQYMIHGVSDYILVEWHNLLLFYLMVLFSFLWSLVMIFRESFLKKNYHNVTFYGSLTFFFLSLLLPFLLMILSDLHDGYQFAYIGGLL